MTENIIRDASPYAAETFAPALQIVMALNDSFVLRHSIIKSLERTYLTETLEK